MPFFRKCKPTKASTVLLEDKEGEKDTEVDIDGEKHGSFLVVSCDL